MRFCKCSTGELRKIAIIRTTNFTFQIAIGAYIYHFVCFLAISKMEINDFQIEFYVQYSPGNFFNIQMCVKARVELASGHRAQKMLEIKICFFGIVFTKLNWLAIFAHSFFIREKPNNRIMFGIMTRSV